MSKEFLKICYDQQAFIMQKYGGVSRYFSDLIINIKKNNNVEVILPFRFHNNAYLKEHNIGRSNKFISKIKAHFLNKLIKNQRIYENCDIYHGTYYYGYPKKSYLCRAKIVSTLHDMTPEIMSQYFNHSNPHRNKIEWFKNSDLIISVSESSKNDLLNLFPEFENRVKRVHLYSKFNKNSPRIRPSIPYFNNKEMKPFFLYVGGRGGYKNVDFLLKSFKKFKEMKGLENIIFAGSSPFSFEELKKISQYGINQNILNIQVDDKNLWYLYKNASALIVPSLSEGFSLPIVEGLVANIPIIASNINVHKEISSSFAYNLNPNSLDEWVDLMLLKNKLKPSERLRKDYSKLLDYFSPVRLTKETTKLYQDLK